jgi:hypothetical protein
VDSRWHCQNYIYDHCVLSREYEYYLIRFLLRVFWVDYLCVPACMRSVRLQERESCWLFIWVMCKQSPLLRYGLINQSSAQSTYIRINKPMVPPLSPCVLHTGQSILTHTSQMPHHRWPKSQIHHFTPNKLVQEMYSVLGKYHATFWLIISISALLLILKCGPGKERQRQS